jgi:hypothetical protein
MKLARRKFFNVAAGASRPGRVAHRQRVRRAVTTCDEEARFEVSILLLGCVRNSDRNSAMFNAVGADLTDISDIESKVRDAAGRCGRLNDDEASLRGFLGPALGCGDCF